MPSAALIPNQYYPATLALANSWAHYTFIIPSISIQQPLFSQSSLDPRQQLDKRMRTRMEALGTERWERTLLLGSQ